MARHETEIMTRLGRHSIDPEKVLHFPRGLMGFEDKHDFTLLQLAPGAPFLVLQSLDDPTLGLLVADPYTFIPDYCIRVGNAEQALLQADSQEDVAVLVTASIPHGKPEETTLNLTGPILINHGKRIGVQVPQADGNFPPQWHINQEALRDAQPEASATAPNPAPTPDSASATGKGETLQPGTE